MLDTGVQAPPKTAAEPESRNRTWLIVGLVVLLMVIAGAIGWWLGSSDDDADAIVTGGGELTEQQIQMLDVIDSFGEAVIAGDGATAVGYFSPNGVWESDEGTHRVADGSLEAYINDPPFAFEAPWIEGPIFVQRNTVRFVHDHGGVVATSEIVEFTAFGEPEILLYRSVR